MSSTISRDLARTAGLRPVPESRNEMRFRKVSSGSPRSFQTAIESIRQFEKAAAPRTPARPGNCQESVTTAGPWRFVATAEEQSLASQSLQSRWAIAAANAQPAGQAAAAGRSELLQTPVSSDPIEVLRAELLKWGMNPDSLDLSYVERPVYYPGGSYVNRLIVCSAGEFSADLMMRNPSVTALEIQRMGRSA